MQRPKCAWGYNPARTLQKAHCDLSISLNLMSRLHSTSLAIFPRSDDGEVMEKIPFFLWNYIFKICGISWSLRNICVYIRWLSFKIFFGAWVAIFPSMLGMLYVEHDSRWQFYINILLWLDPFVLGEFNVTCGILLFSIFCFCFFFFLNLVRNRTFEILRKRN